MVIEAARNLLGKPGANSTEFDANTQHPVIDLMPDQRSVTDMGGTMRLGVYPCSLVPESIARRAYGVSVVDERHRHRFEVSNAYREAFESVGFWPTGLSPDNRLSRSWRSKTIPSCSACSFTPSFSPARIGLTRSLGNLSAWLGALSAKAASISFPSSAPTLRCHHKPYRQPTLGRATLQIAPLTVLTLPRAGMILGVFRVATEHSPPEPLRFQT